MKKFLGAKNIFNVALFALSVGLLVYFCLDENNLATLLQSLPTLNSFWLIGALLCMLLVWAMDSTVIYLLISHAYAKSYPFFNAFRITMVGQYFNSVSPYAVAGQPMQLLALTRQGVTSGVAISALVRKFLVYQTSLTIYSLAVILIRYSFFRDQVPGFMMLAWVGFLSQAALVVVLFLFSHNRTFTTKIIHAAVWLLTKLHIVKKPEETSQKVKDQLEFYIENNKAMQGNPRMSIKIYICTVLQLTALFSVPFFIYKAFHNPGAPIVNMISAQSFVTMTSSYAPLPGAAGAAESSFLMLFQMFFQPGVIKQAMLLWRLITYYSCIVAGAFFAGLGAKKEKMTLATLSGKAKSAEEPGPAAPKAPLAPAPQGRVAVSACLCGKACRFDGTHKLDDAVCAFAREHDALLICPESMVMKAPRPPSELTADGLVFSKSGEDLTNLFADAAQKALDLCLKNGVTAAILKEKSPSCGVHQIYDGTFSGRLVDGCGVTAGLLKQNGIQVMSEDDFKNEGWVF